MRYIYSSVLYYSLTYYSLIYYNILLSYTLLCYILICHIFFFLSCEHTNRVEISREAVCAEYKPHERSETEDCCTDDAQKHKATQTCLSTPQRAHKTRGTQRQCMQRRQRCICRERGKRERVEDGLRWGTQQDQVDEDVQEHDAAIH